MAEQKFVNLGPIYTTAEKYEALRQAGTLEIGREYKIVDWEAQEKLIAGNNITIADDGKTISAIDTIYDDSEVRALIAIKANDSEVVKLSGNQDIYDQKTFHEPVMYSNGLNATKLDDKKLVTVGAMSPERIYNLPEDDDFEVTLASRAWVESKNYLTEHQSLDEYRKSAAQDVIDNEISSRVTVIEGDYLKAADKTELENKISSETTNRENADLALDERIKKFELPAEPEIKTIDNNIYLFANGVTIRIVDNASENKNIAYYLSDSSTQKSITFPYDSIVHGGGYGTATNTADFNSTCVIMDSGKVKSIYGGSRNYGNVGVAVVIVNDGAIKEGVQGGGGAAKADMVNSVGLANITCNGGTSLTLFGGGMGFATVGKVNMIVNGGTHKWVTAGGSNGVTGSANLVVNDGNIICLQAVNRGIIQDATITIKGGTITNVYGGGETGDSSVNGKCEKTIFHIESSFNGNLKPGTYGGVESSEGLSGDYIVGTITDSEATACNLTPITIKQDKLTAGDGIIIDNNVISVDEEITNRISAIEGKEEGWDAKQDKLVSGENIKTINNNSLLGSGNLQLKTINSESLIVDSTTNGTNIDLVKPEALNGLVSEGWVKNYAAPWLGEYGNVPRWRPSSESPGQALHIPYKFDFSVNSNYIQIYIYTITADGLNTFNIWSEGVIPPANMPALGGNNAGLMTSADATALRETYPNAFASMQQVIATKQDKLTAGNGLIISSENVIYIDSENGIAIYDDRIDDANEWLKNGYVKTSANTPTANLPSCCTGKDRWGVLLYVAENNENKAGLQQYFPIDGTYKGRVFYRSVTGSGVPTFGEWNIVPWSSEKQDTLIAGTGINIAGDGKTISTNIPELPDDASTSTYVLKAVNGVIQWVKES